MAVTREEREGKVKGTRLRRRLRKGVKGWSKGEQKREVVRKKVL